jgi:putative ABC transport system permease protein
MAVSGALVLTDTLGRSFDALFQTVNQNLDVQVSGAQNVQDAERGGDPVTTPIPAELVGEVAAVPGVQSAIGVVIADGARVVGPDGKVIGSAGPPRFGVGWRGEVGFTQLREGRGPQAPEEVAISAGLAKQGNFQVGDRIGVLTLQPKRTFTLVGIFGYTGGRDSLGGETRVAFTEPVAQQLLLGRPGTHSVINVQAQQGISPSQLRDAIQAGPGRGYVVRTRQQVAADQAADVAGFLGFIRAFLLGFAGVALFVGVFLILNTFSILVAQRTRELALLRALVRYPT